MSWSWDHKLIDLRNGFALQNRRPRQDHACVEQQQQQQMASPQQDAGERQPAGDSARELAVRPLGLGPAAVPEEAGTAQPVAQVGKIAVCMSCSCHRSTHNYDPIHCYYRLPAEQLPWRMGSLAPGQGTR